MASLERATKSSCYAGTRPLAKTPFSIEQKTTISDAADRQRRLASVISQEIIPRLMLIHHKVLKPCEREPNAPSQREIEDLAHLVLGPDVQAAANYVLRLRQRGLPLDVLYIELLEPAARLLGKMWDEDRCDFVDVTLGVARLQELLAIFNDTNCVSSFGDMRRAITATTCGEQHRFGLAMVEKFLRASGWHVRSEFWLDGRGGRRCGAKRMVRRRRPYLELRIAHRYPGRDDQDDPRALLQQIYRRYGRRPRFQRMPRTCDPRRRRRRGRERAHGGPSRSEAVRPWRGWPRSDFHRRLIPHPSACPFGTGAFFRYISACVAPDLRNLTCQDGCT